MRMALGRPKSLNARWKRERSRDKAYADACFVSATVDLRVASGIAISLASGVVLSFIKDTIGGNVEADAQTLRLMREMLQLAKTRNGADEVLESEFARDASLTNLVVALRQLPERTALVRQRSKLRLVVDNTR